MHLTRTLRLGFVPPPLITLADPLRVLSSPPHDEPPTVSPPSVVPACFMCREPIQMTTQVTGAIWCW
jgi:hypothetical protein